jgi:hypothetical protein
MVCVHYLYLTPTTQSVRERLTAFLLGLIISQFARAQTAHDFHGLIVDDKTNMPVPFATVKLIKGKEIKWGVISNAEGDFQIPAGYVSLIDSVVISCIGYRNSVVKIREGDVLNTVRLRAGSVLLREVVITPSRKPRLSADKIVRMAINNIPKNYPSQPFSYTAYYRDYQREEKEYVNLNESIVGVFDKGLDSLDYRTTQIKLLQYRENKTFRRDSLTAIAYDNNSVAGNKFIPTATVSPFGGNELTLLLVHDAIRNYKTSSYSFVYTLSSDFLNNHFFKLLGTVYLHDVPLYHISFKSLFQVTGREHIATGEIYIEHGNFAIHKLSYSTFLKEGGQQKLLYQIQLEYSRAESLMHLNYISFNNFFKYNTHLGFKVDDVAYDRAMNAFIVTFNHVREITSALNKKNYDFKFQKKPFVISKIKSSEKNDKEVFIFVANAHDFKLFEKPTQLAKKFDVDFKNIRDKEGNLVNEIKYKTVNQFRELFVQRIHISPEKNSALPGFISKQKPLSQNVVDSVQQKSSGYWMNTPLKEN